MIWPTICVDNFFDDPNKVKNYAKTLIYSKDPEGKWPGERTDFMHSINNDLFLLTTKKIMALLYPMTWKTFTWTCEQYFQKIPKGVYKNNGWVHRDDEKEFTAIIYLSEHKNCGTSIYHPKNFSNTIINTDEKEKCYKNTTSMNNEKIILEENNNRFEKTIHFNSKFNRLILFDGNNYHAAEKFNEENINEDRLTLITFFSDVKSDGIKFPISEMKRI